MNKVILIGNLSRDPEYKQTNSGKGVCNFTLAVNRRKSKEGQQEADFINCVAWEKTAELVHSYLSKGRKCGVTGQIQTRSYKAQDGSTRYVTEVLVDDVEFLGAPAGSAMPAPDVHHSADAMDDGDLPL